MPASLARWHSSRTVCCSSARSCLCLACRGLVVQPGCSCVYGNGAGGRSRLAFRYALGRSWAMISTHRSTHSLQM